MPKDLRSDETKYVDSEIKRMTAMAAAALAEAKIKIANRDAEIVTLRNYNKGMDVIQTKMEAEIERLRAALKPFADVGARFLSAVETRAIPAGVSLARLKTAPLVAGDLVAAAKALRDEQNQMEAENESVLIVLRRLVDEWRDDQHITIGTMVEVSRILSAHEQKAAQTITGATHLEEQ